MHLLLLVVRAGVWGARQAEACVSEREREKVGKKEKEGESARRTLQFFLGM